MLTITTTARLDALRQRADQAETARADTNRRLEELLEQRHVTGQERLDTRNEAAAVRDELEAAKQLAREVMASETRTRSVCDFMMRDASAGLAARDRTIAELRAELDRALGQPAEPELPEHTVLQFRTIGGGLVALIAAPDEDRYDRDPVYGYQCLTCGGEVSGAFRVEDGRRWANEHAAVCRAIPPAVAAEKVGVRT
ncbi:hypothetical protein GCM10010441_44690 [Kitasatospora paracochleata]|uniref:Uncharacterized protein n=1 Tax=Kitasatospora paracochleata TaxID=58354 RepID=A0ABT1J9C4_9ACTN|nr:hypothetical protein [Kitasatospora paracochleata]MCP2314046.1 hypothetical protein [Kitasatospora paracochleata]